MTPRRSQPSFREFASLPMPYSHDIEHVLAEMAVHGAAVGHHHFDERSAMQQQAAVVLDVVQSRETRER